MIIADVIVAVALIFDAVYAYVAVGNYGAAELEGAFGRGRSGIAQLVAVIGRPDKVVHIPHSSYGRGLEELVPLKARARRIGEGRGHLLGLADNCKHIIGEAVDPGICVSFGHFHQVPGGIWTVAHIQVIGAFVAQYCGIKRIRLARARGQNVAVLKVHVAVEFVLARGRIAHCYGDYRDKVERVVQIIPAVGAAADVGRKQRVGAVGIERILILFIYNALVPPTF